MAPFNEICALRGHKLGWWLHMFSLRTNVMESTPNSFRISSALPHVLKEQSHEATTHSAVVIPFSN